MKNNNNEGRLVFKDGELIMIYEKKPVIQIGFEMIVLGMIVHKN